MGANDMSAWAQAMQLEPEVTIGADNIIMEDLHAPISADSKTKVEQCQFSPEERAKRRNGILALQEEMLKLPENNIPPVEHFFAPGVYARQMFIPKGHVVIGKIHRHAHLNIVSFGRIRVATEFGPMMIEGPHTFVSQPGTKRVVHAEEDTLWTTIHVTDETDLEKIEQYVIAPDYEAIGVQDHAKALEGEAK